MNVRRLTPSVPRFARLLLAGLVWTSVGATLLSWTARWLQQVPRGWALLAATAGVAIGAALLLASLTYYSHLSEGATT